MKKTANEQIEVSGLPPRIHLEFLDGVRGFTALYVVLCHLWISGFSIQARTGLRGLATNWISYAHLAVDVFIVLSGFCLAIPVAQSKHIKGGALEFFKKRARRILPPFYASLIICIALSFVVQDIKGESGKPFLWRELAANALLLQDVVPGTHSVFNPPFWSVAVEWKIYFLFPFLVLVWRRFGYVALVGSSALIGFGITAALCLLIPDFSITSLAYSCPWYVFLFGMGVASGLLTFTEKAENYITQSQWVSLCALVALALLLWLYPITGQGVMELYIPHWPLIDTVAGAMTASFLMWLTCQARSQKSRTLLTIFQWKPLVVVGTFSYSLYLVHHPIIDFLRLCVPKIFGIKDLSSRQNLLLIVIEIPIIIAVSYGFFLAFERPFLSIRKRSSSTKLADAVVLDPAP